MFQYNNQYGADPMAESYNQILDSRNIQDTSQFFVPGMTAGTLSPGGFGAYNAGAPAEPIFGSSLQSEHAAQFYGQLSQSSTGGMMAPGPFPSAPGSPTQLGEGYTQYFLRTQIGQKVRIEFLIGTDSLQDRRGTLLGVGIDYVLLREEDTDDILLCDIYSIKFVTIYK